MLREQRLRELIEENKLSFKMDKSELHQAIKFLHECGVILHYSDLQTKLSELYFLDPEWLCTLMAHIITFKHISFVDEKGVRTVGRVLSCAGLSHAKRVSSYPVRVPCRVGPMLCGSHAVWVPCHVGAMPCGCHAVCLMLSCMYIRTYVCCCSLCS